MGTLSNVNGASSYALGALSNVNGASSYALGVSSNVNGASSYALGESSIVTGKSSYVLGHTGTVKGDYSYALGALSNITGDYSYALGSLSKITGIYSYSLGYQINVTGSFSYAIGYQSNVTGISSYAIGYQSNVSGNQSYAIGQACKTSNGNYNYALGYLTEVIGNSSYALGYSSIVIGDSSYSLGNTSDAFGNYSYALGSLARVIGDSSYSLGYASQVIGNSSYSLGDRSTISGIYSYSLGYQSNVNGNASYVMGNTGTVKGDYSYALGALSNVTGNYNYSIGYQSNVSGNASYVIGYQSNVTGIYSYALGYQSNISGNASYVMGHTGTVKGDYSYALGALSNVTGISSYAIGYRSNVSGNQSYALGYQSNVSGNANYVMGNTGTVKGDYSYALGALSIVTGISSYAIGYQSNVSGNQSYAIGQECKTSNGNYNYALGYLAEVNGDSSYALGYSSRVNGLSSYSLGNTNFVLGNYSYALGSLSSVTGNNNYALGNNTNVTGNYSIAIGSDINVNGLSSYVFGDISSITGSSNFILGVGCNVSGLYNYAIGYNNTVLADNSYAFGQEITIPSLARRVYAFGSGTAKTFLQAPQDYMYDYGTIQLINNTDVAIYLSTNSTGEGFIYLNGTGSRLSSQTIVARGQGQFSGGINVTGSAAFKNNVSILGNLSMSGTNSATKVRITESSGLTGVFTVDTLNQIVYAANLSVVDTVKSSLIPTGSLNIGSTTSRWSNVYGVNGDFSGVVLTSNISSQSSTLSLQSTNSVGVELWGNNKARACATTSGFRPAFNYDNADASDLGTLTGPFRWRNLYINNVDAIGNIKTPRVNGNAGTYLFINAAAGQGVSLRVNDIGGVVALETIFRPNTDNTVDLGGTTFAWKDIRLNGNILSNVTGLSDIGTSARPFRTIYATNGNFTGLAQLNRCLVQPSADSSNLFEVKSQGGSSLLNVDSFSTLKSVKTVALLPQADNSYVLGNTGERWSKFYTNDADLTGLVSITGAANVNKFRVAFGNTSALTVDTLNHIVYTQRLSVTAGVASNLLPTSNKFFNIGSITMVWFNLYTTSIDSSDNNLYLNSAALTPQIQFALGGNITYVMSNTGFYPRIAGKDLGATGFLWRDVYATNDTIKTSDAKKKNTIISSDLGLGFIEALRPVSYKMNDGTSDRTHYGLIAQEVEEILPEFNKTNQGFAGLIKYVQVDAEGNAVPNEYDYGLRYSEFISPMIKAIQELSAQNKAMQETINLLKARIEVLESN